MLKKHIYHICEYGIIRDQNDYPYDSTSSLDELYLPQGDFECIYNFISSNQDESKEGEKPFSLFSKGKRRQIKIKNFVGVIETNNGMHLEILPKIHINKSLDKLGETKTIFLRMLRHLKNTPFANISTAHLDLKNNFPILEVFIKSYINEAETVFNHGVKSDYILSEGNIRFLKGKLLPVENIKHNLLNKTLFFCEFSNYSSNIPANRIIKTTLIYLLKITTNSSNYYSINRILSHLEEIETSSDIQADFNLAFSANRLFNNYKTLLAWSEIFMKNKSFTNFKGENMNLAILFPMEKIFEDYIAHLICKYADGYKVKVQDKSFFLVEKHKEESKFRLKPDILVKNTKLTIIDTKWKLLDQYAERKNYNISQADMYQLYAYGKKYSKKDPDPKLILLYPSNVNFFETLGDFVYEGDLILKVIPFDLTGSVIQQKQQIETILLN